jgi:hypothetical protein
LTPTEADEADVPWVYPDLRTALRGLMAAGPAVKAINASGEDRTREAIAEAIVPFRSVSGGYRLENTFRYVIAKA